MRRNLAVSVGPGELRDRSKPVMSALSNVRRATGLAMWAEHPASSAVEMAEKHVGAQGEDGIPPRRGHSLPFGWP